MQATVIALAGQKGGVGKSTSAVALAAALADLGDATLLVDCDHQASATLLAGIDLSTRYPHLGEALRMALAGRDAALSDYVIARETRWGLVAGHLALASLEMELVTARGGDWYLRDLIDPTRALYRWIIVDCPPSLAMLTTNALHAADAVLMPTIPDLVSEQGLGMLLDTMRTQVDRSRRRAHLAPLDVAGVFLTKVRPSFDIPQLHRASIAAWCGAHGLPFLSAPDEASRKADPKRWIEIPDTINVPRAAEAGVPITRFDANGARTAYQRLAAYIRTRYPHA